jgi:TonB family protein
LYFLSSKGKDAVLYEYRGPFHYGVRESILSPNDQLNGIQAKGNANFNASAVRMMYPKGASTASVGGQWTPWKGGDVSGNGEAAGPARSVLMTRKSGHWELMGGTALQGTDAVVGSRISCESATSASPLADFDQASVRPTLVVAISGNAQVAKLVKKTKPIYPQVAQDKHVGGRVTFTVMIDQEGKVQDVKLVSGHPLLVQAAREAVLQWEYAPTIINGNPVGVSTTINVDFALAH